MQAQQAPPTPAVYETARELLIVRGADPNSVRTDEATRAAIGATYAGGWDAFLAACDDENPFLIGATF